MAELTESEAQFFLGLVAGEGSFSSNIIQSNGTVYVYPIFRMLMDEEDGHLLRHFHRKLDLGTMSESKGSASWSINKSDEVDELIDVIDEHRNRLFNVSLKSDQYDRWKKLVRKKRASSSTEEQKRDLIITARSLNETECGAPRPTEEWLEML